MKSIDDSSIFYYEVIKLIDLGNLEGANRHINMNIDTLKNIDDIALAYLNCGFINDKLGDHRSAIDYFSKSIYYETDLPSVNSRSKDISFSGRSNSRYKNGDYHGAIEDKRKARNIRLLENDQFSDLMHLKIDYRNILLGTFVKIDLDPKYKTLIKVSTIKKSRYDLISDYKKVISKKRQEEVIKQLELISESKYNLGDYKGSIKASLRAEKFY